MSYLIGRGSYFYIQLCRKLFNRKLREARGYTQDQLATAVGMIRSNVSRIEADKHRPTLETLEKIASALKVSVADLVARR